MPAEQGVCNGDGRSRTDPDDANPAENRKVGGSIPSLPTGNVQLSGPRAETSPLDEPRVPATFRAVRGRGPRAAAGAVMRPAHAHYAAGTTWSSMIVPLDARKY